MYGPAEILLRRSRLVSPALLAAGSGELPPVGKLPRRLDMRAADVPSGVAALEFELLQLGFLLPASLYHALSALSVQELTRAGRRLLHALREDLGANAHHVPLFRKFPDSVPADTVDFYVRRVFSLLLQNPQRPCVLCGETGRVHPVSPCGHLVCRTCWDGSDFSACPICHRRIDLDDPFLLPDDRNTVVDREAVTATTLLRFSEDAEADCRELAQSMMARHTPMPPHERADLVTLLEACWPRSAAWLPERIPVKETRAAVLAAVLRHDPDSELLSAYLDTATDVLRLLYVLMGADPGLRERPARRGSLPRAVRRRLLACLDRTALPYLIEDLGRYGEQWKYLAEVLHPHEHHARFPNVALAFAALRGTRLDCDDAFCAAMRERAAAHPELLAVVDGRLRARTFNSQVECALEEGRYEEAFGLLTRRPGDLVRRLSHLLRLAPELMDEPDRLAVALRRVAPGVLIAALGQLRTPPGGVRLFLPRGGTAKIWTMPDVRPALPDEAVLEADRVLTDELLRRAAALPPLTGALLDEGLADVCAPTSERTASSSLVRLTRGTVQPIPQGRRLRFFLHWMEPKGTRVDLDLSVAVYDEHWQFVGLCDYTRLRLGDAVTHSGDLTSAPAPLGASEFIDVDTRSVRGRYLVPIVFSYNDVPFDELLEGFAGFMEQPRGLFDPLAVRQRFGLAGRAKILLPLVADLWSRTMRWADINLSAAGYGHNVDGSSAEMARIGAAMERAFDDRVSLWEVACWHAAARAEQVVVRGRDGSLVRYARRRDEDVAAFAARMIARADAPPYDGDLGEVALAVLVDWDVELPQKAEVYALHLAGLVAADLLTGLGAG